MSDGNQSRVYVDVTVLTEAVQRVLGRSVKPTTAREIAVKLAIELGALQPKKP